MSVKNRLSRWLLAVLVLGLSSSFVPAQERADVPEAQVPLKRAVLFTSGVGYFQRDGMVEGNARMELKFDVEDVNDLLKSLVLQDLDGGTISSVTYASQDPAEKTLKSFAIDLTGNPSLADLLNQVRGEQIQVAAPEEKTGTIVGVETKRKLPKKGDEEQFEEVHVLNLLTAEGLRSVPLDQIQQIRFLREELQEEFKRALTVLATTHDTQKKSVVLEFTGDGQRQVRVGYISESPLWKTSYRLVLSKDAAPFLQGWAIVENTSDEDWNEVSLALVSGRPISFLMDLYQPLYVPRPTVELELFTSLRPRRYEGAMDEKAKSLGRYARRERKFLTEGPPAAPPASGRGFGGMGGFGGLHPGALATEESLVLSQGVSTAAQGGEVGELFRYEIEKPVTLPRQKSALLPIVNATVGAEKLSVYNQSVQAKHPVNAVRLKNTTELHFMQGPITVFDESTYAGDGLIADLEPGSERIVSYALDLDVEVDPKAKGEPQRLVSVKLAKGTLIASYKLRKNVNYGIKNRGSDERQVLVEHPIEADWTLIEPKEPAEKTRDVYRFPSTVEAGKGDSVAVTEERSLSQQVGLSDAPIESILIYVQAPEVDAKVKDALAKLVRMKQEWGQTIAERTRHEQSIAEIGQEQGRIRQNMERLAQNSELYRRYVTILTEQEDRLMSIRQKIEELRDRETQQKKAIDDYLLSLDVG